MGDQTKKISFGFSKLAKKTAIVSTQIIKNKQNDDVSKVEFIDCLEGKSIILKDPVKIDEGPLVIPLQKQKTEAKLNHLSSTINVNRLNQEVVSRLQNQPTNSSKPIYLYCDGEDEERNNTGKIGNSVNTIKPETLDEIAAKEILEELNQNKSEDDEKRVFSVPLTSNAPSGEKESTLEDYDNVPVGEFGLAMLRGMGWAPGKGIGKTEKLVAPSLPLPRPKGMGLGADKVIKSVEKKSLNEDLKMVKGSFIRILAGTEKDSYGQVEGFDDESGRLIVKLALKNDSISLNEFMVQLVDAQEFKTNSKVINVSKYEQYKQDERKKANSEGTSKEKVCENACIKSPHQSRKDGKPKSLTKNYSSSSDSEEGYNKDAHNKVTSVSTEYKRISSRSPSSISIIKGRTQSEKQNYQSKSHEFSSKYNNKSFPRDDKKQRSVSSDRPSSNCSISFQKVNENKHYFTNTKTSLKNQSLGTGRQRPSSTSSSSDSSINYSKKKKNKYKKKKSCSNKYRSRSRSRSPRKHKNKSMY